MFRNYLFYKGRIPHEPAGASGEGRAEIKRTAAGVIAALLIAAWTIGFAAIPTPNGCRAGSSGTCASAESGRGRRPARSRSCAR